MLAHRGVHVPGAAQALLEHDQISGTESLRGYRQALVTVTPQPGQQLTALNLQDESWAYSSLGSWLDVAIASPVLSALQIGET